MKLRSVCPVLVLLLLPFIGEGASTDFRRDVLPFLDKHCKRCHGPDKSKGDLRVDEDLSTNFLDYVSHEKWGEVINVLNGHEMPPEDEPQPSTDEVAKVVDWITGEMVKAEMERRDAVVVLRRMNRAEYRNTIRDLIGIDFDVSALPLDPPTGGFDNNGGALTMSPLHVELYLQLAGRILDRALVEGERPSSIRWRFQPEEGDGDRHRIELPNKQRPIVHGAKCRKEGDFTVMHHDSWNLVPNARGFNLPEEGEYIIRVRAGGWVPSRAAVVDSAKQFLVERFEKDLKKNPGRADSHKARLKTDLDHFQTDRMYDYGPPRLALTLNLGGQPQVVAEWDVDAPKDKPQVYEFRVRCTTESAGIRLAYGYDIPRELENFWFQGKDEFARPEVWLDWFEIEGPIHEAWPPASHRRLLAPAEGDSDVAAAKEVLASFMRRAYRRPVTDAEVGEKLVLFEQVRGQKDSFVEAIKIPLMAVMASPHFLYLSEPSGQKEARALSDHELASRLSYFLWSSMPDETLFQLADQGRLRDESVLLSQVDRMLADPKSEAFVKNFAGQWLGLREVGANPPAQDLFRRYDRHLEISIVEESESFFREILKNDLSVMNFVKSDFAVVNERLARFYGIPGVKGDHLRRVKLPADVQRGGVITHASMLTITSNGTRTSPVKRGTWLLKNILGMDPGLPVANVGDIAPKVPGIDKATVRQRLEIHRELPQCARCHNKIDPLGLALENFDGSGAWRLQEGFGYKGRISSNDPFIDASARLPDGTEINGVSDLQDALVQKEDLFLGCLAGKLMTYALGRELGIADQPAVDAVVADGKKNDYSLRSLLKSIVTSHLFQTK